jgi:hypothetical protein
MLSITLGTADPLTLQFQIRNTPVADLWRDRMQHKDAWPLDHPDRFYGFNTPEQEQARAELFIKQCIKTINSHRMLITRPFEWTQDCLNYLHNIFEIHHGLLDQQTSEYWQTADNHARRAISDLNLAVHRCENVMKGVKPRFICTWYGMPKKYQLSEELKTAYGDWRITFGTVYLSYCEIGKTAEDLANDNDNYIAEGAFKPFSHYSADFNVQFHNDDLSKNYEQIQRYIDRHQDFFLAKNITSVYNVKARPLRFPVADLIYTGAKEDLLVEIAKRQWISQIEIE